MAGGGNSSLHEEYYEKDVELSLAEPKSHGRSSERDRWEPSDKLLISMAVVLVLAVGALVGLAVHTVRAGVFGDPGL